MMNFIIKHFLRRNRERYFHIDLNIYDDYWIGNMRDVEYVAYCYGQDHRVYAKPTVYAVAQGAHTVSEENVQDILEYYDYDLSFALGSGYWWLRSPGCSGCYAASVDLHNGCDNAASVDIDDGGVRLDGCFIIISYGVRPAIKVAY